MGLNGASDFLYAVRTYRIVNITGKTGGHKTALAFRVAYDLLTSGFSRYCISNVRNIWRDLAEDIQPNGCRMDTVIILDEGGLFLDGPQAKAFQTALRKLNCVVLIPSVAEPSSRLKSLTVWCESQFFWAGIPLLYYKWRIRNAGTRSESSFFWWKPKEIYGCYDTEHYPRSDAGIAGWLLDKSSRLDDDEYTYSEASITGDSGPEDGNGDFYAISELQSSIEIAAEDLQGAAIAIKKRARKR